MLYFRDANLAFLATPKNASTSVHAALAPRANAVFRLTPRFKHVRLRRYQRYLEPFLIAEAGAPPETVALIRDPMMWLASWYRYRARPEIADRANSTAGISFETFVGHYLSDQPPPVAQIGSQARFLTGRNDQSVTTLYRLENLSALAGYLSDRLGEPVSFEHRNRSHSEVPTLSAELTNALRQRFEPDYALHDRAL